jgi:hypothetical protein
MSMQLEYVANRWRMFYFHYFLSVLLESLFVAVVGFDQRAGMAGTLVEAIRPSGETDFMDGDDVWVLQAGCGGRLGAETMDEILSRQLPVRGHEYKLKVTGFDTASPKYKLYNLNNDRWETTELLTSGGTSDFERLLKLYFSLGARACVISALRVPSVMRHCLVN